ncbi:hypothetical protein Patl1_10873 [Pistacia atlantica]|uniref:Uncharacterized protein n=1 Tax=Pistacia atlantica TaxID=434234 RepID=A0ACC1A580_9ROSI|nr:hypothetical protein Patl1_10873 [Pistacia atlantica]
MVENTLESALGEKVEHFHEDQDQREWSNKKAKGNAETHKGTEGTNLDSLEEFVEHGRLSYLDMDMSLESPVELGELSMAHGRTAISFKDLLIGRADQRSPSDVDDLNDLFDEQLCQ